MRSKTIILAAVLWPLIFGLMFFVLKPVARFTPGAGQPTWTAASGKPVPPDFTYLMYPKNNAVDLFDEPNGRVVGRLERALANSQRELDGSDWVQVVNGPRDLAVRTSELRFEPPATGAEEYDLAFVRASSTRMYLPPIVSRVATPTGCRVTLQLRPNEDRIEEFKYEVTGARPRPIRMTKISGLSVGFAGVFDMCSGALTASVLTPLSIMLFRRLRKPSIIPSEP